MKFDKGLIKEIFLDGSARIDCPPEMIPAPGQYLLAQTGASNDPLPVPLFSSLSTPNGFRSAPPTPRAWKPGDSLALRGPIGHGFAIPPSSRKIALVVFDKPGDCLKGLIPLALKQNAELVVVIDGGGSDLPEVVEVQPRQALLDVLRWADYSAFEIQRDNVPQLKEWFEKHAPVAAKSEAQVLIHAPMPCGALADCGVCAISNRRGWQMVCRDGPVFNLRELL